MVQGIDATFSLLQKQQQDRADEIARQKGDDGLTNEILGGLIKGGVAIGNAVLKNKTYDFMNTTEQRAATQLATQADTAISRIQHEWDTINNATTTPIEYLTDQIVPYMREQVKAETPDWMEGLDEVSTEYEAKIYEASKQVAQKRLDILTEARDVYEQEGMDDFSGQLEMVRNRYRVTDLGDLATQSLAGLFDGKSKTELDMEEILAYKDFTDAQDENSRAYHGKRLVELFDAFERTGNLAMAKVTSINKMIANKEIDPARGPVITEEVVTPVNLGGGIVVLKKQLKTKDLTRKDLQGQAIVTLGTPTFSVLDESDLEGGGSLLSKADVLSATRQAFNIQEFYQDHVKPEGQEKIILRLENNLDENGRPNPLSMADLGSLENYKAITDIVFDVITGDEVDDKGVRISPNLLVDDEKTRVKLELLKSFMQIKGYNELGATLKMEDDAERTASFMALMKEYGDLIDQTEILSGTAVYDRGQP